MFLFFSAKCSKQANRMVLWSGTYDTVMCNGAYGSIGFWCLPCPIVTVANMFTFYFLLNFSNFWKVLRKQVSFLGGELLCILYIVKKHMYSYLYIHITYIYMFIYVYMYIYMYTAHICPDFPGKFGYLSRSGSEAMSKRCWKDMLPVEPVFLLWSRKLGGDFHRRSASNFSCLKPWSLKSQKSWVQLQPRMIALRGVLMQS